MERARGLAPISGGVARWSANEWVQPHACRRMDRNCGAWARMSNNQRLRASAAKECPTERPAIFEGATEGRQLYREAKLMQAIDAMKIGNYKKALQVINEATQWPENLGEGKPYDADIDERLENWMAFVSYENLFHLFPTHDIYLELAV